VKNLEKPSSEDVVTAVFPRHHSAPRCTTYTVWLLGEGVASFVERHGETPGIVPERQAVRRLRLAGCIVACTWKVIFVISAHHVIGRRHRQ